MRGWNKGAVGLYVVCNLFIASVSHGAEAMGQEAGESRTPTPAKPHKQFGSYLAIGNPYPSLLGLNAAYQPTNDIRVSAGYGEVEVTSSVSFTANGFEEKKVKAQSYAAGGEYLFLSTAIRPVVGARLGYFTVSGDGKIDLQGFKKNTFHGYSNIGVDWLAQGGFNMGTGLNVALFGSTGASFYLNMGYFF